MLRSSSEEPIMTKNVESGITRRQATAMAIAGGSAAIAGMAASNSTAPSGDARDKEASATSRRMPVVFLPHGGGPWPFVELNFGDKRELSALTDYLVSLRELPPERPRALLVISAHWEEPVPTVMSSPAPPMLYDYYGFPPESYTITWPAPGDPVLASRVRSLLTAAGIENAENTERGYDHGTFVPLKLTYPDADIPVVQLSLKRGLDPAEHLAIGRAIAPLRDEGVFIIGSGMTYHNLRAFNRNAKAVAASFDAWLRDAACRPEKERDAALSAWTRGNDARLAHPREEHLIPLMVIAGAATNDVGRVAYNDTILDLLLSAYHFGDTAKS
jgi:aromatic ring-opening dioxygenase catalytic subunit (LigB family)